MLIRASRGNKEDSPAIISCFVNETCGIASAPLGTAPGLPLTVQFPVTHPDTEK